MKLCGMLFFLMAVCLVYRDYSCMKRGRLLEISELSRFVSHLRAAYIRERRSPREATESFSSELLTKIGFLPELLRTGDSLGAFRSVSDKLSSKPKTEEILTSLFEALRQGAPTECEEALLAADTRLGSLLENERSETEKSIRVSQILSVTFALGLILLFL